MMIRRLNRGEADLYRSIRLAALKESPDAFCTTYEDALHRPDARWIAQSDEAAEGPDRAIFLAFENAVPVALAALYRDGQRREIGELIQVWVAPDHRGTPIATELMDALFAWAARNAFAEVRAEVFRANPRALRFYEKYGFRTLEEQPPDDTTILIKSVASP